MCRDVMCVQASTRRPSKVDPNSKTFQVVPSPTKLDMEGAVETRSSKLVSPTPVRSSNGGKRKSRAKPLTAQQLAASQKQAPTSVVGRCA